MQIIRAHLGILLPSFLAVAIVGFWIMRVLRMVLAWSSFGPMFNIAVRDPGFIVLHGNNYLFSVLSSIPSIEIALFLCSLSVVLLLIRFIVENIDEYRSVRKQIYAAQYHEHIENN